MNYEKKYKEALKRARMWRDKSGMPTDRQGILDDISPELKESEDERIRGAIIDHLKDNNLTEWAAWLKKQGDKDKFIEKELGCIKGYRENAIKRLEELEKQGEQKANYTTIVETGDGGMNALVTRDIEIPFGAKDSDLQEVSYYIPEGFHAEIEGDKVTIKKGEQKPNWSEEDEKMFNQIISIIEDADDDLIRPENISIYTNWFKSLKDRVKPKQKWSEEDESRIDNLCYFLEKYGNQYYGHLTLQGTISWLKSIRPQNIYNPYKAVVESIAEMCKRYDKASHSGLRDFYDNVKVKCKDSKIEYVRTDALIEKACDAYCWLCDTKECGDTGECKRVEKFRKRLMK